MDRTSRRASLVAVVLGAATTLTGCGPVLAGAVAVSVKDGRVMVIVATCGTTLVETRISSFDGDDDYRDVTFDHQTVPDDRTAALPSELVLDDLRPGVTYSVSPTTDDIGEAMLDASFRKGQLVDLAKGEVVVDEPPDEGDADESVLDLDTFVDRACD